MKTDYEITEENLGEKRKESHSQTYENLRSALADREMTAGINAILRFLNIRQRIDPSLPLADQLDRAQSEYNIRLQRIELDDDWYNSAVMPMLVEKPDGDYIAVVPDAGGLYRYIGKNSVLTINEAAAKKLTKRAICFYKGMDKGKISVRDFMGFLGKTGTYRDYLIILGACSAAVAAGLFMPWVNSYIFRHIIPSGNMDFFAPSALILSAILTITAMRLLQAMIMNNSLLRINASLQSAVFSRLMSIKPGFFKHFKSGELSKLVMELADLSRILSAQSIIAIISMILSLVYLVQIHSYAPEMFGFVIIISMVLALITVADSIISAKAIRRRNLCVSEMSGFCYEMLSGIEQIKLGGAEHRIMRRWSEKYLNVARNNAHPLIIRYMPVYRFAITIVSTAVIFILGVGLSSSDYIAFSVAYAAYITAISTSTPVVYSAAALYSLYKIAEPMLSAECEDYSSGKNRPDKIEGRISFSNVSFAYSENLPKVIDELSIEIEAGECVGIVGSSGCGKSTLIRLMLGFETPSRGNVYIDGRDLREIDLNYYRSRIGTVLQNAGLFSGDIYSNIAISKPDAGPDEVKRAVELAGLSKDMEDLPMGLHTMITDADNGAMSGGQLQRIMIARAILGQPSILIFDEATSALDNVTQKKIMEAVNGLGCTRIIVAHRLSTIEHCDKIIVMDKGRIADEGTFDELFERNELFRSLTERQKTK